MLEWAPTRYFWNWRYFRGWRSTFGCTLGEGEVLLDSTILLFREGEAERGGGGGVECGGGWGWEVKRRWGGACRGLSGAYRPPPHPAITPHHMVRTEGVRTEGVRWDGWGRGREGEEGRRDDCRMSPSPRHQIPSKLPPHGTTLHHTT